MIFNKNKPIKPLCLRASVFNKSKQGNITSPSLLSTSLYFLLSSTFYLLLAPHSFLLYTFYLFLFTFFYFSLSSSSYFILSTCSFLLKTSSYSLIFTFYFLLSSLLFTSSAQTILTKSEAVATTLENNYGIQVAKNNVTIAEQNTRKEVNGYMPTINANGTASFDLNGSGGKLESGDKFTNNFAAQWGVNAGVTANYTLFDKVRDYNLAQLKESVNLSNLQVRQEMEINLLQLFNSYYEVARLSENLKVLQETMQVSKKRLQRAQYRYDYGQSVKLDILNAEVDIQRDSINILNIRQQIANAKRNLNVVMGRDVNSLFEVDTTVVYADTLTLARLLETTQNDNIGILLTDKNIDINRQNLQIIEAGKKPVINASGGYSLGFSHPLNPQATPQTGFNALTFLHNRGLNLGVNVSWNLFDGGNRKVRKQITEIGIQNQQIQRTQLTQELQRDLTNAWESYQTALFILQVEKNNMATALLNFERTNEQFKAGQVSSVEFRQAQLNQINAAVGYNTAKYNAKVIELQLLQLSGGLLDGSF